MTQEELDAVIVKLIVLKINLEVREILIIESSGRIRDIGDFVQSVSLVKSEL